MFKYLLFAPIIAVALTSCGGSESEDEETDEFKSIDAQIQDYLEENGIEADKHASGLYISVETQGDNDKPSLDSYLTLNYEGRFLDGSKFDGTDGMAMTFDFPLAQTIQGWQIGIPQFGKGGKGMLVVPPSLGYGSEDFHDIPGGSILVFDIEIIDHTDIPPYIDMSIDYSPEIESHMKKNGLKETVITNTRTYVIIDKPGNEEHPTLDSYLTLKYEGRLLDGTVFDGTGDSSTTFGFPLRQTIFGWQQGIPLFGRGGKGTLLIPPYVGYGEQGSQSGNIPPNAILEFDIELIDWSSVPPGSM